MKNLARDGRTVLVSIHAPRSEIWGLFDRVVLLSRGSVLYSGEVDGSLGHFDACGYEIPPFVNPAEFLIDLAAHDNRSETAEEISRTRIESLREAWKNKSRKLAEDEKNSRALGQGPRQVIRLVLLPKRTLALVDNFVF